jgi:ACS family D-galactonate transporter-like MFS transporter
MASRYRLVMLLWAMQFVNYLDRINISVAAPTMMKSLSIDPGAFGMVLAAFTLGYALMQIPGGMLADRYGAKALLVCAPLAWSLLTGLTGLAGTLTSLIVVRLCFGLAEGSANASLYKLVGDNFTSRERAAASGVWQSALAIGPAAVAPLSAWLLIASGWRQMFFWFTIPGLLMALVLYRALPPQKDVAVVADTIDDGLGLNWSELFSRRSTWLVMIGYMTFNIGYWGYLGWMPSYLALERHLDLHALGYGASIPYVAGLIGLVLSAWLSSTVLYRYRPQLIAFGYLAAGVALYFTFNAQTVSGCLGYLCLAAFFIYGNFPPTAAVLLDVCPLKGRGTFVGIANTFGQAGGFFAPLVVGFVVRATHSFTGGFLFMIAALVCAACSFLALFPYLSRKKPLDWARRTA